VLHGGTLGRGTPACTLPQRRQSLIRIGNSHDRALLQDQALQFEQIEARGVGVVEIAPCSSLPC